MRKTWTVLCGLVLTLAATGVCAAEPVREAQSSSPPATTASDPVAQEVRDDWKRQYDAMLAADGSLLPTEEPLRQLAVDPQATQPLPGDRTPADVVLRRTKALLDELREAGIPAHEPLAAAWSALAKEVAAGDGRGYELYERACRLRRKVVAAHPLCRIPAIVFVVGRVNWNLSNMHAPYGSGRLCILREPFSDRPELIEPLKEVKVARGRYDGRTLAGGCFFSPEVSWDGRTVFFAWAEKAGRNRGPVDKCFTPESTYKIFAADIDPADGYRASNLRQLTDGPWNDSDPCELPNGRIVFCSGRRNTNIRCNYDGGYAVNSTLFSMAADGSDQRWLSLHETGEWAPSVDHDGRIVYTRWDYMDRRADTVHNLWTCYPDGREPRAPHGNYPAVVEKKPDAPVACVPVAELGLRAIPGQRGLYVGNSASRYTRMGTLVRIDLSVPDDRALSQLRVITPWQKQTVILRPQWAYAGPWPLSARHFLAERTFVTGPGSHGNIGGLMAGISYIDVYGNQELLFYGGNADVMDPIPLRARPRPPVIPDQARGSAKDERAARFEPASIQVANVYDSDFAWPEGTKIAALRIVQVVPKTSTHAQRPKVSVAYNEAFPRFPLGTVPVMEDGSAYFEAPVGREIYFQALDAEGRAVQSMRSGTYVHPGERLTCQGCHEPKHAAPRPPSAAALLALRLAPQGRPWKIQPEVTDAQGRLEVLTFPRHIQPILDRRCAACHEEKKVRTSLAGEGGQGGWSPAYRTLSAKVATYAGRKGSPTAADPSCTAPGTIGALASPALKYFTAAHHDVKLPPEEWRVVVAWMDCLAPFYGWDWDLESQERGEKLVPGLDFDPENPLALDRPQSEWHDLLTGWRSRIVELQRTGK
jgi:hypothetical protein